MDRAVLSGELSRRGRTPDRTRAVESRVRDIRLARGLTQVQLAGLIGTNLDAIRKAERGYLAQLRTTSVVRLANALGCGAADLFPILGARL